jgi:hypothetical protein
MSQSHRRDFLKSAVTGAAGLAAGSLAYAQTPAAPPQAPPLAAKDANRISILSYSFLGLFRAGKMDVFGYLESCRHRYGLDAANLWNGMLVSTDESYLKKIREALDEANLTLAVLTVDDAHVWDPDPALRAKHKANALAHLNAARILGAEFVRIDAGGSGASDRTSPATKTWSNEVLDAIVAGYKEYAKYAADHGFNCTWTTRPARVRWPRRWATCVMPATKAGTSSRITATARTSTPMSACRSRRCAACCRAGAPRQGEKHEAQRSSDLAA